MSTPSGNPYADEAKLPEIRLVADARLARTVGVLNIVFGLLLLLGCNVSGGLSMIGGAVAVPLIDQALQLARNEARSEIEELEKKVRDEPDNRSAQGELRSARRTVRELDKIPNLDPLAKTYGSRESIGYAVVDNLLGVPLNLAMIASGVGILSLRSWGRKLAIVTMILKIVRTVPTQLFYIFVLAPQYARGTAEFLAGTVPPEQAPAGLQEAFYSSYLGMFIGTGITMLLVAPIYPAVCWFLLTRPKVKAAFH